MLYNLGFLIEDSKAKGKRERKERKNKDLERRIKLNSSSESPEHEQDSLDKDTLSLKDFCKFLLLEDGGYNSDQIFLLLTGILKLYSGDDVNRIDTTNTGIVETVKTSTEVTSNRLGIESAKINPNSNRINDINQIRLKKIKYKKSNTEIREKNNHGNGIVNKKEKEVKLKDKDNQVLDPQSLIKKVVPNFNMHNYFFTPKTIKLACSQFILMYSNRSDYLSRLKNEKKYEKRRIEIEQDAKRQRSKTSSRIKDNPDREKAAENYRDRCYEIAKVKGKNVPLNEVYSLSRQIHLNKIRKTNYDNQLKEDSKWSYAPSLNHNRSFNSSSKLLN